MKYEKVTVFSNGIPYLTTPDFLRVPGLAAGFSTRRGGVSQGHCAAFNFGFSRGDDPHHVAQNYRLFAQALGADVKGVSAVRQVHSARVLLSPRDGVTNPFTKTPFQSADGVVTGQKGIFPACFYADCIPLLLYAPDKKSLRRRAFGLARHRAAHSERGADAHGAGVFR